ncbi:MAG TPA: PAS domain-containing sensor histidine kinase [Mycobacteriales bacterium]|nr:PAS domain-containing sensor histidine kinase [Mycobacteriales bacterium]
MAFPRPPETSVRSTWRRVRGHEQDIAAELIVARGRVLLATAVVLVASLRSDRSSSADTLLAVGGYAWVPFAGGLALAASIRTVRTVRVLGALGDLAMLLALHVLIDGSAPVALAGYSLVAVLAAYTGGREYGYGLGVVAMSLVLLGEGLLPPADRIDRMYVAFFGITLALLLVVVHRATSEQRRAEVRSLRLASKADAILARVADCVVVTDARGRVIEANPAAVELLGADSAGERLCGEVLALCHGERRIDCSSGCGLQLLFDQSPSPLGREVWRQRADGSRQPLLANASSLYDERGAVVEVVHSLRDITRLKEADEAKTLFLATASHELKTPLTVIRGFAETLLRDDVTDDVTRYGLRAIATRAKELTAIVERLLLSSRIEAGRLTVETTTVDLLPIICERADAMSAARHREIPVTCVSGAALVVADEQVVATIVDHLVDNAIKYSPAGGPVAVSVTLGERSAQIEITDSGVGMTTEQMARCFEKFWQADSNDRREFGGSGIGLYIVESLVESIGGTVEARSRVGAGSTFTVTLCRADVAPAAEPPDDQVPAGVGERSMVREFMRQLGVPTQTGGGVP